MSIVRPRRSAIETRPVLLGPVTYLKLGKSKDPSSRPIVAAWRTAAGLYRRPAPARGQRRRMGADRRTLPRSRSRRGDARRAAPGLRDLRACVAAVEDHARRPISAALGDNLETALSLCRSPDFTSISCARPSNSTKFWRERPRGLVLSLGVIDGRNVWRADLPAILERFEPAVAKRGADHIQIAPSCSLLHVPIDLEHGVGPRSGR